MAMSSGNSSPVQLQPPTLVRGLRGFVQMRTVEIIMMTEVIINRYHPGDPVVIVLYQPPCLTLSPQHLVRLCLTSAPFLVTFFPFFFLHFLLLVCSWKNGCSGWLFREERGED